MGLKCQTKSLERNNDHLYTITPQANISLLLFFYTILITSYFSWLVIKSNIYSWLTKASALLNRTVLHILAWWFHMATSIWAPFLKRFFHCNSNSMEISFHSHHDYDTMIATNFCAWQDSCAVVACAKICCDLMTSNGITPRRSFHRIWIAGKKSLVKQAHMMAWCRTAAIHYLNQCGLIISEVFAHLPEGNFSHTKRAQYIYPLYKCENY